MDSGLERDLEQVRYHEWILNEYRKLRDEDTEIPREGSDSTIDSLKRGIGWSE